MQETEDEVFESTKKNLCRSLNLPDFLNLNIIKTKGLLGLQQKILYSSNLTSKKRFIQSYHLNNKNNIPQCSSLPETEKYLH